MPMRDKTYSWVEDMQCEGGFYTGQWLENKKTGFGKLTWPDGSSYEGIWMNDQANGLGVLK
jgi:hypothetical protein